MTTRAIINGQMATSGSRMFLTGAAEVAQNITTRLLWFYGEAFLELDGGTPWFQTILGKSRGPEREAALKRVVLETPGVAKLTSFRLDVSDNRMTVSGSVLTIHSADEVPFAAQV